jgi:hypothetical protein
MRRISILIALLALFIPLGACGGDDDSGDAFTEENLSKQLVDANLLEKKAADCVADSVFTELSDDQIKDISNAKADFSGGDLPPELQSALTTAIQSCVSSDGTGGGGTDTGS